MPTSTIHPPVTKTRPPEGHSARAGLRPAMGSASRTVAATCGAVIVAAAVHAPIVWAQPAASAAAPAAPLAASTPAPDYSPAEKAIFMRNQLGSLKLPASLRYNFRKSGSMEAPFEDRVSLAVRPMASGGCCAGSAEFLTGARRIELPDVEGAEGNPVLMYFLERDVREMQRLTKGSQTHFRKRIRMAIYNGAAIRDVSVKYRGRDVAAQEIVVSPFLDDPNRPRFEKLATKAYRFVLSPAVPGGVVGISTRVDAGAAGSAPLLLEELLLEGATLPRPAT